MTIRKPHPPYMKPLDGEGSDLGGLASATETAIAALGEAAAPLDSAPAPAESHENDAAPEAIAPATEQASAQQEPPQKGSRMAAMLDALTDDPNQAPTDTALAEAAPEPVAAPDPLTPVSIDQEEAQLLEGVNTDRSRDRVKKVFAERRQLEQDMNDFRGLVKSSGMNAQEFSQTLEFGRLMNSGDEKNLRVALEMIEGQRAALYQKLGVQAPGVDLLAGQDDLKTAVDNMEISRERAVELSQLRKAKAQEQARSNAQHSQNQERQSFEARVKTASGAMESYLDTRKNEVDHPARIKVIADHFRKPENLQKFVQVYRPEQWAATVQMMYDNIQVPKASQAAPQPIRSRPANLGLPAPGAGTAIDRIAQRMESMGL